MLREGLEFRTDHPSPKPAVGEALVRVRRAGICRTDLEIVKGYKGFAGVLGHEFVGELCELPAATADRRSDLPIGARVVAEINCVPPNSRARTAAERAHAADRTTLGIFQRDGAFAEYVSVPIENLHPVPDEVSDDEAVFTEPLAAACQILEQVHLRPGQRVYVLGDGKLGLLCAQVLACAAPSELVLFGRKPRPRDFLQRRGIVTRGIAEWDGARTADVVVECTGSSAGFELARRMLRPRGTLVLKSTYAVSLNENPAWQSAMTQIVVDEITIVGSRCGPFSTALALLAQKRVEVVPLIAARYPLEAGAEAFAHAAQSGAGKVIFAS